MKPLVEPTYISDNMHCPTCSQPMSKMFMHLHLPNGIVGFPVEVSPKPEVNTVQELLNYKTTNIPFALVPRKKDMFKWKGFICQNCSHLVLGYNAEFLDKDEEKHIQDNLK